MSEITLRIQGVMQRLSDAVERALKRVGGVEDVNVSLERNEAVVKGTASYEELASAVEKAGYQVQR